MEIIRLTVLFCIVLISNIGFENCIAFKIHGLHSHINDPQLVRGENIAIVYHHKDEDYYFQNAEALADFENRGLYNITVSTYSDNVVDIRILDEQVFFIDSTTGQLTTASSTSNQLDFMIVPIPNTDRFILQTYPKAVQLVTPNARPPFKFYLSSHYPDEPNAEFSLKQFSIEETYANKRENINKTISIIRSYTNESSKGFAYLALLTLMQENEHIEGVEIFTFAQAVIQDFGTAGQMFRYLPSTVQLLFGGGPLQFKSGVYPMKYSWASDLHENIKPYTFTQNPETGLWAITYSYDVQLTTGFDEPLINFQSSEKQYHFQIQLFGNGFDETIQLLCYNPLDGGKWFPVLTTDAVPDFYFKCQTNTLGTNKFTLAPYTSQ